MITALRHRLEQEKGKLKQVQFEKVICKGALGVLQEERSRIEKSAAIISMVGLATQQELEFRVGDLVSMALETIPFDENYRFQVEFVQRRGRTEADLFLVGKAGNRVRILEASGGGVANVVAFALRVSLWSLSKGIRPVLVLDEPFPFLRTKEAHAKAGELLKTISNKLGLQIIMITGEAESQDIIENADRVFYLRKKNGRTIVEMQAGR